MEAQINGNKLYYEVHGNQDGETIFFIHGAPGLGDCRGDIKAFSELGDTYQLVFIDMRGSGRSEGNRPFTHEQWTADIEELAESLSYLQLKFSAARTEVFYPSNMLFAIPNRSHMSY